MEARGKVPVRRLRVLRDKICFLYLQVAEEPLLLLCYLPRRDLGPKGLARAREGAELGDVSSSCGGWGGAAGYGL